MRTARWHLQSARFFHLALLIRSVLSDSAFSLCWARPQIAQVESVVSEGVELLAHRPLEVSPFDQYEPQVLRHPATREAFVRLAHHYLRLSEVRVEAESLGYLLLAHAPCNVPACISRGFCPHH